MRRQGSAWGAMGLLLVGIPVLLTCGNPGTLDGNNSGGTGGQIRVASGGAGGGSGGANAGGSGGQGTPGTGVHIDLDASVPVSGSGGQGGSAPPTDEVNCGITSVSTTKQPANLLLVLDRSNSMSKDIASDAECASGSPDCTTRWKAITDAVGAVLPDTQDSVHWGLKFFGTSPNGCDVSDGVDVAPAPGNASKISEMIAATGPSTGTPTSLVIEKASKYLLSLTDTNPRHILLATDGQPWCYGDKKDQPEPKDTSATAITAYASPNGIKVFVVGMAIDAATSETLNAMAAAGGTTQFYPTDSPDSLRTALEDISAIVATCSFSLTLTASKGPPDPANIAVFLDGERLPADAGNGFILTDNNTKVEVTGSYCEAIKNGTGKNVQVLVGCAPIPIGVIP